MRGHCRYDWREAGDEDTAEMGVEKVDYFASVRVEDTVTVTEAFDRASALFLAVYIIVKQLRLTLTGPDNRCFKPTDGIAHCCLDLFTYRGVKFFQFGVVGC